MKCQAKHFTNYTCGWGGGRAEGSKKEKKKSCEEVTKGDYMDNKDIFYHTDRRKPALITMDNKSQKGNGSTRQREAMKVCTIWPNRLGELEHKNLNSIFHTSRAMMWMKRKRSRR